MHFRVLDFRSQTNISCIQPNAYRKCSVCCWQSKERILTTDNGDEEDTVYFVYTKGRCLQQMLGMGLDFVGGSDFGGRMIS